MHGTRRFQLVFGLVLFLFAPFPVVRADTGLNGFNIHTWRLVGERSGLLTLFDSRVLPHLKSDYRFTFQGAGALVEGSNPVNGVRSKIVGDTFFADLSAVVGIKGWANIGLTLPVLLSQSSQNVNTQQSFTTSGVGDLLLDTKVKVLPESKMWPGVAGLFRLSLPMGTPEDFTGWQDPTAELRMIADKNISSFRVATNFGYRLATKTNVTNRVSGVDWNLDDDDRLLFGIGADYTMPFQGESWNLLSSISGDTVATDMRQITTPIEADIAVQKRFPKGFSVLGGAGRGLTSALGSPSYRVFASLSVGMDERWKMRRDHGQKEAVPETMSRTVSFEFDSIEINEVGLAIIKEVADFMSRHSDTIAFLRGFTDAGQSTEYNIFLSGWRAEAVKKRLLELGIGVDRLQVEAHGETNLLVPVGTWAEVAKNRRVEIEVVIHK